MDTDKLIQAAVGAAIGTLTKAAADPILTKGREVWDWIKRRATGADAEMAKAVEAEPGKPSAPVKVTALLQDLLHDNPAAIAELRQLLGAAEKSGAVTQTANFQGDRNEVNQVAGSGNIIGSRNTVR
ncbi:hypothetical protein [Paracraurococcus ruber]|uniref:Uncharacterized protein n=1 Tax=Paracraurococcus ruber TaxID=77675 RepID=A0ABS1CTH1_9PROT|nr:hypothetical protein [Paracraurococcus ruber]MBK1657779.1 hypothetical protein [Paracraurococcus ruber]TDG29556.1 hypothetical protein E2C05_17565 [Paracraurococcus ruber]